MYNEVKYIIKIYRSVWYPKMEICTLKPTIPPPYPEHNRQQSSLQNLQTNTMDLQRQIWYYDTSQGTLKGEGGWLFYTVSFL